MASRKNNPSSLINEETTKRLASLLSKLKQYDGVRALKKKISRVMDAKQKSDHSMARINEEAVKRLEILASQLERLASLLSEQYSDLKQLSSLLSTQKQNDNDIDGETEEEKKPR